MKKLDFPKNKPIKSIFGDDCTFENIPEKDRLNSSMPEWYNNLINKTYNDLTLFDVTRMLMQNIYLNLAVERAKEFLTENPLCGEYYDGHLLELMSRTDEAYLDKEFYEDIISKALIESETFDWNSAEEKTEFQRILKNIRRKQMSNQNPKICKVAKKCGACQLSNMDYARQLKFKQAGEVKLLKRFGHVNDIIGMEAPYNYRNKAQYLVKKASNGNIVTGVYQSATGGVAVTDSCFINDKTSNLIVKYLRKIFTELKIEPFNPKNGKGTVRHIMVRNGYSTGEYMVVLVCIDDKLKNETELVSKLCEKFSEIKTVVLNVNRNEKMMLGSTERVLFGNGYIEDILCGKRFRISPRSFYQVNPIQTEILYNTAIDFAKLTGNERILDAYCGIGTIGISAADNVKSVVGVEVNGEAVKDAKINAKLNGLENAVYYKADAAAFMREAAENHERFDVVFTDPPRAGCSKVFLSSLATMKPDRIIYVSCNLQTLARDLYFLIHNGYKVEQIQPVDMFPHTKHVETVVSLSRKK